MKKKTIAVLYGKDGAMTIMKEKQTNQTTQLRDRYGRFCKAEPEVPVTDDMIFYRPVCITIIIAVCCWIFFTMGHSGGYQAGYSIGHTDGLNDNQQTVFDDGFLKGKEYSQGWERITSLDDYSWFGGSDSFTLCNESICRRLDTQYNARYEYARYPFYDRR